MTKAHAPADWMEAVTGEARRGSPWHGVGRFARLEPLGMAAGVVLAAMVLTVVLGPLLLSTDALQTRITERFSEPGFGTSHWLGTDQLGRDILARVLEGGRVTLATALAALLIGVGIGSFLGLIGGGSSHWLAQVLERLMDGLQAIPALVLGLAIATSLGNNRFNVLLAISAVMLPSVFRVVRSAVLSVRATDYVVAATAVGATWSRTMARHVAPNVLGTVVTIGSIWVGNVILLEASLGFLGVGTQPPHPSWGNMLSGEGRNYMVSAPWIAIVPGIAISITVLSANLVGDSLRTYLDPRARARR